MTTTKIPYKQLRHFSNLIKAYLSESVEVEDLYNRYPHLDNFEAQITEKAAQEGIANSRIVVTKVLMDQYADVQSAERVLDNIELLKSEATFTITTGHQLNLFTGPLYFLYKIISTINLCKVLKKRYPQNNFVPIYWMATEDHDFEEIQYFNFEDRKLVYDREAMGAVGRLDTHGLEEVDKQLKILLGSSKYAEELSNLFLASYSNSNLARSTRHLAHEIFKDDGLVIIDADNRDLKSLAIPYFAEELREHTSYKEVGSTLENWNDSFKIQVNPRQINLFYLDDNGRYRIIYKDDTYYLDGSSLSFSKQELLDKLHSHPECFSPNVIMRPLYQEIILPNLCYIGGGGEIAYWLELKRYFESQHVVFPMLLLRNSALLITKKQQDKIAKLNLTIDDLFKEDHILNEQVIKQVSELDLSFEEQKQFLRSQFDHLYQIASKTDESFTGAVAAQERKQIKGLENLEKRLLKAQKRKWNDHIERVSNLKQELFPHDSLQERQANFSQFYKDLGPELIDLLKNSLEPLESQFTVVTV